MSEWKGLDPGGTEQLWEPDVIHDMLSILKEMGSKYKEGDLQLTQIVSLAGNL